jgi:low affinity Fe/Cu permease
VYRKGAKTRAGGRALRGKSAIVSSSEVRHLTRTAEVKRMKRREAQPAATFSDRFGRFASVASAWLGSRWAFVGAGSAVLTWGVAGPGLPLFGFLQLVINTTIVTFLMVFLIQNTQNRDARAINLKLDELIRAIAQAQNQMINIESLSDVELDLLRLQYDKFKTRRESAPLKASMPEGRK